MIKKLLTIVGILSLVGSLFFLTPNMTGNVVNESSILQSTLIGSGLFILGLGLLAFRKRKIKEGFS
jgi:LPXTG-motif cell wall-anchored protein